MKAIIQFLINQAQVELVLMSYFVTLLIYMLIVFVLKKKNKKSLSIYLLKHKDTFYTITYAIFLIYVVAGCTVYHMVDNIVVYFGTMLVAAVLLNYLFILGYGLKKIKDVEFSEVTDTYNTLIEYTEISDELIVYMTDFINYIGCLDEDEISDLDFYSFCVKWIEFIQDYIKKRIKSYEYDSSRLDIESLANYIREKNSVHKLWYTDKAIKKFAEQLHNGEEVVLASNIRIIPLASKRFRGFVFVEGKKDLLDCDKFFLLNTFNILSLL